jgi:hypothetical protein
MINKKTGFVLMMLSCLPMLVNAEVYKWRDKDGSIKYSDTPPPSNVKIEAVGKKVVKPTQSAPAPAAPAVAGDSKAAPLPTPDSAAKPQIKGEDAKDPAQEAAKLKQRNDEIEKKNKAEKEAQAKLKAENCRAAKSNYETFKQGGRVSRTNEKGEKEYLDDKQLQDGMAEAQKQINSNCN